MSSRPSGCLYFIQQIAGSSLHGPMQTRRFSSSSSVVGAIINSRQDYRLSEMTGLAGGVRAVLVFVKNRVTMTRLCRNIIYFFFTKLVC